MSSSVRNALQSLSTIFATRTHNKKRFRVVIASVLLGVAIPTAFPTAAGAAQIGGENLSGLTGSTVSSGTATITLKYLRKANDYSSYKAWVWCNSGSGTWGTGLSVTGSTCTNGARVDLSSSTGKDSWGTQATFTVTGVSNLASIGIIVYTGSGDCCGTRDSQSTNNRFINMQGSSTTAWLSDDGKNIYDTDPKTKITTSNPGAFRIHYNRPAGDYTNWYARFGFESGTNSKTDYRNSGNSSTWENVQSYNFLTGATSGSLGTVTTGTDAFGPWVQLAPSATFYTSGYSYLDFFVGQATSLANADAGTWSASDNNRYMAPTVTSGTQDIYLKSGDTAASATNPYSAPTVTSATPTALPTTAGTSVTITGSNLYPVTNQDPVVNFDGTRSDSMNITGGTNATVTAKSATSITFTAPALAAGSHTMYVSTAGGVTTSTAFTAVAAPTITSVTPSSGPRGSSLTVVGTNLTGLNASWTVGGAAATPSPAPAATSATLAVPVGASLGLGMVAITTAGGTASSAYTVNPDAPTVSGLSPSSGLRGSTFTITGTNLDNLTVTIGGVSATVTPISATSATITVPSGVSDGARTVAVSTAGGSVANAGTFTVVSPVVTSVTNTTVGSGSSGKAGDSLTIAGTNLKLTNAPTVTIGGTSATVTSSSSTSVVVTVPNGLSAGSNAVVVSTGVSSTSNSDVTFTQVAAPTITSLSTSSGARGSSVTVTGTNLTSATFTIGGVAATVAAGASATSATLTVPISAAFAATNVVATTLGGTAQSAFTVTGFSGTVTLKVHYNKQSFDTSNTYLHTWLPSGSGTLNTTTVDNQSAEVSVSADGQDSYGSVATIRVTGGLNVQQICYLVWTRTALNTFAKDTGSAADRCPSLTSATTEIWIRNYDATVSSTDPFAGINPNPNRPQTQSVTVHYDGNTGTYPKLYLATRSDLNDTVGAPYTYWVSPTTLDFTTPVSTTGPNGSSTSTVGSDTYGRYVTYTFPYNAEHTTWAYMIVGNAGLASKDAGQADTGNRYAALNASGTTEIWLKTGDSTGNAAFTANPKSAQAALTVTSTSGTYGSTLSLTTSGGSGSGAVSYVVDSGNCSVTGSTLSNTAAGDCYVTATKALDSSYMVVSSSSTRITISVASQSALTITSTSGTYGSTLPLTTSGGSGSGAVSYVVDSGSCSVTGSTLSNTAAGDCSVTATKAADSNYSSVSSTSTTVTIAKAASSVVSAPSASGITYGQSLADSILSGGSGSVAGSFAFTSPSTAPNAGTASYSVTFTPTSANYATSSVSVSVVTGKASSSITTAPSASGITYGQSLADSVLSDGVGSVAGSFAFTSPSTAPNAGTASYSVTFTPTSANYATSSVSVSVVTGKASSSITTAPSASGITYGQSLADSILSGGSGSVAGSFAFTSPSTAPNAGTASYGVTFTPASGNYATSSTTVSVVTSQASVTITSNPTASGITYGQTLADSILSDGVASVDGSFAWVDSTVRPLSGNRSVSVKFTPTSGNYSTPSNFSITIAVAKAASSISVAPSAAAIPYGLNLASASLSGGTGSVAGSFAYTAPSTAPSIGTASYEVTFTPTSSHYNSSTTSVSVTTFDGQATISSVSTGNQSLTVVFAAPVSISTATITDFKVQYKLRSALSWVNFSHAASANTLTYTITGLSNDALYDVRVSTIFDTGSGLPSTESSKAPSQFGYSLSGDGSEATVTGCNGTCPDVLSIPSEIGGASVTAIAGYSFDGEYEVTEVEVPSSVKSIGYKAFWGLSSSGRLDSFGAAITHGNIYSVTLHEGLETIGGYAFANQSMLNAITIPDSVTSLGAYALRNNTTLSSVTLGSGLTSIGKYAFQNDGLLTSISLPAGLTSIAPATFWGTGLTSITIPSGVTEIGPKAFSGTAITSVTLPNSVTKVWLHAFRTDSLRTVVIGTGVTSIGNYAFASKVLSSVQFLGNVPTGLGNWGSTPPLTPLPVSTNIFGPLTVTGTNPITNLPETGPYNSVTVTRASSATGFGATIAGRPVVTAG